MQFKLTRHGILLLLLLLSGGILSAQDSINPVTSQCWFTAQTNLTAYNNPERSEIHATQMMQAGRSLRVTRVANDMVLVVIDHAMGFWVKKRWRYP
jgi:hypothetical protein